MANIMAQGNKTIACSAGHLNIVPLITTCFKCSTCDKYVLVNYLGAITDKDGNNII